MRALSFSTVAPLATFALLAAGWPACQPSGTATTPAKAPAKCGLTVVYQNNDNGEIEPCG